MDESMNPPLQGVSVSKQLSDGTRPPIILTGMHRSGTSMMARFLHLNGVHMGDQLKGAHASNPYGHFEEAQVNAFHRALLSREAGHSEWVQRVPSTRPEDYQQAQQIFQCLRRCEPWGWKEPRTSLFLPLWFDIAPDSRFIFMVRHPIAVADSLIRRHGQNHADQQTVHRYLRQWLIYNRCCAGFAIRHPRRCLVLSLERGLKRVPQMMHRLSRHAGVPFAAEDFRALFDDKIMATGDKPELNASRKARLVCAVFHSFLLKLSHV